MIERRPLREAVRAELLRRLYAGALPPDSHVNEAELAGELGVSRTPLREALANLADEGILEQRPNRGFWVPDVSADDVRDLYELIAALEVLALRTTPRERLGELAGELRALTDDADDPDGADERWHALLVSRSHNRRARDLLPGLKLVAHRFEVVFLSDRGERQQSWREHSTIADALAAGDPDRACATLERNWRRSHQHLVAALRP